MTKTVKITNDYISLVKNTLKIPKPLFYHVVDRNTLDKSTINIPEKAIGCYSEIKADVDNVKILNTKIDEKGRLTRDDSSIHSTIAVNLYEWETAKSIVELPDSIADQLIAKNIVEEVV
ncbi:MAG: hypothetical protein OET18_08405 [Desulfobacterales bacterium]|nr:hypothetical protein [Desulfobacterales bacterium]